MTTAPARRSDQWLAPLQESGLRPAVFEPTTCALAQAAGLSHEAGLLLHRHTQWL
ncbi:hypothetical protein [Candidatus Pantoea persica]|uniref:hypothetical protein n=1 Tax=Candidatus Pantoea persica TaxID=2518128 RepID=UPI00215DA2F0|nr:hypothetical protein [Candidatus Pantoea persica]MBA2817513.1 pilus assembly protein HofM [Candidatus Pantoea persica]